MNAKPKTKRLPRKVVAVRISAEAHAILTARLRKGERLSDRLRPVIEREATRAA